MSGVGLRKLFPWVCEMAQQVKALDTKLDDLSSTRGRYWKLLTDYSCDFHTHNGTCVPTHKHTHRCPLEAMREEGKEEETFALTRLLPPLENF